MFIGRERELDALNKLYKSNKFEFAVIYGRRRVGKTALINEFIGDKKAIYFMGVESNAKQNLENFSKSIMEFASGIETESSFLSFQAALEYVFKLAENERINIKQRQAEGIRIAKEKGVKFGRPTLCLPINTNEILEQYLNKKIRYYEAMKILGVSKGTFFKIVRQRRSELKKLDT